MKKEHKLIYQILRFGKFVALQTLVAMLTLSCMYANNSNVQKILEQRITLNMQDVQLKNVLNEIEQKAGVSFTYSPQKISTKEKITIRAKKEQLSRVLESLFPPLAIDYRVFNDRTIVLTKTALELQEKNGFDPIRGTVTDSDGAPLIGATVLVKGTSKGAVTDLNGGFTIDCAQGDVLVISYTGYQDKEITVSGSGPISISLSEGVDLESVTVIGSRGKPRTNLDRPVPIDVISVAELNATNQMDIGQALHYSAPSFNAVKFGINDLAPLVDPASLRGLAPDQTLLLVNGKRRHKVSFFNLNHGVGKGQLGNDINAIPSAAIKRAEILRDGAAAQYGSDAIAGVMNMQLKDNSSGGSIRMYTGVGYTFPKYDGIGSNADEEGNNIYGEDVITDGATFSTSVNFGLPWGENGFVSATLAGSHSEPYDRSGVYTHSAGWYPDDSNLSAEENAAIDAELRRINGIDLDRAVLGAAENTNGGFFINAGRAINEHWDYYAFGGYTQKRIVGGIFSRAAARTDRNALDIFPNGFNPETPSDLTDWQLLSGAKGTVGDDWNLDFSMGYSGNNLDLYNRNTVNPSLGSDSPTEFYTGSLNVTQTLLNADVSKDFGGLNIALGTEVRFESFQQSMGQTESWVAGPLATREVDILDSLGNVIGTDIQGYKDVGSTGREGYSDRTDGEWTRNNIGVYAEAEYDISDDLLVGAAVRLENYSDFGSDFSYKVTGRYKILEKYALRGSVNRSFRAPSLAQLHYSNFAQIAFDDDGNSVVTPFLPIRDVLVQEAFGITELQPETSFDIALGATAEIVNNLSLTIDAYQISLEDRIVVSGGIPAGDYSQFDGAGYDEINVFTNAVNTTTQGLDFVTNYKHFFAENNRLGVTLAMNFNQTEVDGYNVPKVFEGQEDNIIDDRDIVFLTRGIPGRKIIGTIDYHFNNFSILARMTNFGSVQDAREVDPDTMEAQVFAAKTVTDLSLTGHINEQFSITVGANNLFDVYPDMLISPNVRGEVIYSRRTNQFGTQGRFVNLSLNYKW